MPCLLHRADGHLLPALHGQLPNQPPHRAHPSPSAKFDDESLLLTVEGCCVCAGGRRSRAGAELLPPPDRHRAGLRRGPQPSHPLLSLGVAHGSEQRWFRQGSALHRWFCFTMSGGLNMQIEHHLFPTVCHCHLRAIKPIVVRRRRPPPPPTALPNASAGFADASLREARG